MGAEGDGASFAVLARLGDFLAIEEEVDGAGVAGSDDDLVLRTNRALISGDEVAGVDGLVVGSDAEPAVFAGFNLDDEASGSGGG